MPWPVIVIGSTVKPMASGGRGPPGARRLLGALADAIAGGPRARRTRGGSAPPSASGAGAEILAGTRDMGAVVANGAGVRCRLDALRHLGSSSFNQCPPTILTLTPATALESGLHRRISCVGLWPLGTVGERRTPLGFSPSYRWLATARRSDHYHVALDMYPKSVFSIHTIGMKHGSLPRDSCQNAEDCGNESENNEHRSEAHRLGGSEHPEPGPDRDRMDKEKMLLDEIQTHGCALDKEVRWWESFTRSCG